MDEISTKQTKIFVCGRCKSVFVSRWLLTRHLKQVHKIAAEDANHEAILSEWWRVYNQKLSKIKR